MRRRDAVLAATLLIAPILCSATSSYVVPTTTLAAQTANNTSAANSFAKQSNNNRGAANISKVDVHTLLYPGASTKVYAHLLLWFGGSNHMSIGYSSTNAAQIKSQIDDMVSRGIDGVVIDWYGSNNSIDQATQLVMTEAEKHPGFTFAIMIDQGAIQWYSCSGCSPQQALVTDLQYIERAYFSSPAYMTHNGQPVVTNFNVDLSYPSVDWNAANAALSTHPFFVFQNNSGFTHTLTDGSYSWVMPTTSDYGMNYLKSFYDTGESFPSEQTVGATYKGFNDTLASWGSNRIMGQQCGQTWLQTFSKLNSIYSSGKQLPYLQLVTWNDYEEGTEIETGVDNCLTVSSSAAGNGLQWSVSGDESTVDHYTVYISSDGQDLMPLTDIATGVHSLNLCGFPIPNAAYTMFVQAVGKPSIANQMSGATPYNSTCSPASVPTVSFSASPGSVTIPAGLSGTFTVVAKTQSGSFNSPIALTCGSLPANLRCSFSTATITPGAGTATSVLTISTNVVTGLNVPQHRKLIPIYASWLFPLGLVGFGFLGKGMHKRGTQALALCALISLGMIGTSCGGKAGSTTPSSAASTSYSVTINGSAGTSKLSTTVNVIVQ